MKRSALGGILAVTLVISVLLVGYLFLSRTSSGYRMQKHQYTMSFFGDRIDALGKQRDLLLESATSMEEEANLLRKRIHVMDVEIENMRERLHSEKKESRTPFYSWERFRFNTSSGLIVIAFLVFIWLLYTSARTPANSGGKDEGTAPEEEVVAEGSVLEEEFQPRSDSDPPAASSDDGPAEGEGSAEPVAAEEEPPGDDAEKGSPPGEGEEGGTEGEESSEPSEEEGTGEKKEP